AGVAVAAAAALVAGGVAWWRARPAPAPDTGDGAPLEPGGRVLPPRAARAARWAAIVVGLGAAGATAWLVIEGLRTGFL
ncbi:MAG TPA: hypothetical protein VHJ34_15765, partial [Actinomycetota bacterium]|nr:hypothetical protein [Actinomycetota bacterium]